MLELNIIEDGDIWSTKAGMVVIPINTVGVMGCGLAKDCKERFPHVYEDYRKRCKAGNWSPEHLHVYWITDSYSLLLFPTKIDWRNGSPLDLVEANLEKLGRCLERFPLNELHVPPLGCGAGGLKIPVVRNLVETYLLSPKCTTYFYQPYGA